MTITRKEIITDDALNFGIAYEKNLQLAIQSTNNLVGVAKELDVVLTKISKADGNKQYIEAKKEEIQLSTKAATLLNKESQVRQNIEKEKQQAIRTQKAELDLQNKQNSIKQKTTQLTQAEKLEIRLKNKEEREEAILSNTLVGAYQKLNLQRTQASQRLRDLTVQLGSNNSKTKAAQAEFDKLDARVRKADAAVKDFGRNVGNYPNQMGAAIGSLRQLATALGVVGGFTLLAREIKDSIQLVRDFEKANATLSGVLSGQGQSAEELDKQLKLLQTDAKRLGATTVKTASEVTQLQLAYARLGFSQSQIVELTEATINGSIALNSNLAETAELTGAMVNSFDEFSAADAPEILDILSLATSKTALDFQKLQTGLPIVAGAANAAGIPFTRLTALLGKLADAGIDTSSSATALRNIFIESAAQGLSYEQILEKIANSSDKLTASNDEFGKRAAVSANVLSQQISKTDELDKALQNAQGTAAKFAAKELDTLDGAIKLLNSAWEGFILNLNDTTDAGGILTDSIRFLAENLDTILNTIGILTGAWLIYKTTILVTSLITRAYTAGVIALRVAKIALTGGVTGLTRAMRLLNIQFAASPIGLFVVALAGAAFLISKYGLELTAAEKAQRSFNDAQKQAQKQTVKEKAALETLVEIAKDETKSKEERLNAIKKLNQISPEYLGNLTLENINTKEGTDALNNYIKALDRKALAQALQAKKEELYTKLVNQQNSGVEENTNLLEKAAFVYASLNNATGAQAALAKRAVNNKKEETKAIQDEIDALNELIKSKLKSGDIDVEETEASKTKKATGKSDKIDLNARRKALFDLAQLRIKIERDAEAEIVNNEKNSIKERLGNVNRLYRTEFKLLENRYNFEREQIVKNEKDTVVANAKLLALKIKFDADVVESEKAKQATINSILNDAFKQAKERIDQEKKLTEEGTLGDIQKLKDQLSNREITYSQYQEKLKEIQDKGKREAIQAVIDQVDAELERTELSADEVVKLEEIKQEALKALRDQEFEDIVEREQKIAELRKKLINQTSGVVADSFGLDAANVERFLSGLVNGFESATEAIQASLAVVGDISGAIFQGRIDDIDREIEASEEFYNRQIELARDDETQKELLRQEGELKRQQLEKKKRKEQRKAAIIEKALAITSVGISTATAVMQTLAQTPLPAGAPLVALTIALGAIQAAAIAAKPIPKFKDGHLSGTHEGLAITNDGRKNGRVVPEVWERNGKAKIIRGEDTLIDMKKGDKIYSSVDEYIKLRNMSNLASLRTQSKRIDDYQAAQVFNTIQQDSINELIIINAIKKGFKNIKINNFNQAPKSNLGDALWAAKIIKD